MKLSEIKELVSVLEKSNLKKVHIKQKDFEIDLEKGGESLPAVTFSAPVQKNVEKASSAVSAPQVEGEYVVSPMVGTFYSSSAPDQPPFAKVGGQVQEDTVVCIIEAMKVMNEVKAGVSGVIAEVLVKNGQAVEFGTNMFRII